VRKPVEEETDIALARALVKGLSAATRVLATILREYADDAIEPRPRRESVQTRVQLGDVLYTQREAAEILRLGSARSLERWRRTGEGPAFVKLGHRVAYRQSDLNAYIEQQTRAHTNQSAPPRRNPKGQQ
jgi:hypothetical protein